MASARLTSTRTFFFAGDDANKFATWLHRVLTKIEAITAKKQNNNLEEEPAAGKNGGGDPKSVAAMKTTTTTTTTISPPASAKAEFTPVVVDVNDARESTPPPAQQKKIAISFKKKIDLKSKLGGGSTPLETSPAASPRRMELSSLPPAAACADVPSPVSSASLHGSPAHRTPSPDAVASSKARNEKKRKSRDDASAKDGKKRKEVVEGERRNDDDDRDEVKEEEAKERRQRDVEEKEKHIVVIMEQIQRLKRRLLEEGEDGASGSDDDDDDADADEERLGDIVRAKIATLRQRLESIQEDLAKEEEDDEEEGEGETPNRRAADGEAEESNATAAETEDGIGKSAKTERDMMDNDVVDGLDLGTLPPNGGSDDAGDTEVGVDDGVVDAMDVAGGTDDVGDIAGAGNNNNSNDNDIADTGGTIDVDNGKKPRSQVVVEGSRQESPSGDAGDDVDNDDEEVAKAAANHQSDSNDFDSRCTTPLMDELPSPEAHNLPTESSTSASDDVVNNDEINADGPAAAASSSSSSTSSSKVGSVAGRDASLPASRPNSPDDESQFRHLPAFLSDSLDGRRCSECGLNEKVDAACLAACLHCKVFLHCRRGSNCYRSWHLGGKTIVDAPLDSTFDVIPTDIH